MAKQQGLWSAQVAFWRMTLLLILLIPKRGLPGPEMVGMCIQLRAYDTTKMELGTRGLCTRWPLHESMNLLLGSSLLNLTVSVRGWPDTLA